MLQTVAAAEVQASYIMSWCTQQSTGFENLSRVSVVSL